jgi:DNA end-binding protein Ku
MARVKGRAQEIQLARRLIDELASDAFVPERYEDTYRGRVLAAARAKTRGKTIKAAASPAPRKPVVDIMDALKASLDRGRRSGALPRGRPERLRHVRRPAARKAG